VAADVRRGLGAYLDRVRGILTEPFRVRGHRRGRIAAAVRAVVDFAFWRNLAPLGDAEAAALATALVEGAATREQPPTRGRARARDSR
jgi:hypothetical protein